MVTIGGSLLASMLAVSFLFERLGGQALWVWGFLALAAAAGAAAFLPQGEQKRRILAISGAALAACLCWMGQKSWDFSAQAGSRVSLTGVVKEMRPASSGTRLALTIRVLESDLPGNPAGFGAIVYVPGETAADYEDLVRVQGKCLSMGATPDFDLGDYYRGEGIHLTVSVYQPPQVEPPASRSVFYWPKAMNRLLCQRADRLFEQPYSGLVRAVLLGDDSQVDPVLYNRFTRAGITHIFVVSGLHVSLAAGVLIKLLERLRLPSGLQAVLGCGAAWGFAALSGFGIPAIRAGLMITVSQAGRLLGRPADPLNSLFLAGGIMAAVSPAVVRSGSFQLTMTAALGVILLAGPVTRSLGLLTGERLRGLREVLGCSLGANLGMLPVLWRLFRGISLVFPLSNLAAVPLLPLILIPAALALLAEPFPLLAEPLVLWTKAGLWLICRTAELLTVSKGSYLGLDTPVMGLWLGGCAAILLASRILGRKTDWRLGAVLGVLLAGGLGLSGLLEQDMAEVLPVYSFNGVSVAVTWGRRAAVMALEDDGQVDLAVEERLRQRNIHTLQDLILDYEGAPDLRDTAFLAEALRLGRVYAPGEADFGPYLKEYLWPEQDSYPLWEGRGYELGALPGGGTAEVLRRNGETLLLVERGSTRLGITRSAEMAAWAGCDVLVYAGTDPTFLRQLPLKCVLLLYEPEDEQPLPEGVIPAWDTPVRLGIDPQGRIRLR